MRNVQRDTSALAARFGITIFLRWVTVTNELDLDLYSSFCEWLTESFFSLDNLLFQYHDWADLLKCWCSQWLGWLWLHCSLRCNYGRACVRHVWAGPVDHCSFSLWKANLYEGVRYRNMYVHPTEFFLDSLSAFCGTLNVMHASFSSAWMARRNWKFFLLWNDAQ